jgi:hypothetical protein
MASDFKSEFPLKIGDREWKVKYDLNVLCDIEQAHGSIDKVPELCSTASGVRWLSALLINNAESGKSTPEPLSESWIGEQISGLGGFERLGLYLAKKFLESLSPGRKAEITKETERAFAAGKISESEKKTAKELLGI